MPAPSPRPMPSADAENGLHRPSGASPIWRLNWSNSSGFAATMTPPARAVVHSPERSACVARCRATSDDEHAVSTVTAGPSRPKAYETRPDTTLVEMPVTRWPSSSPCRPALQPYPDADAPANTPVAVPCSDAGSIPARSSASHATSSGLIPKNPASNPAAPYTKPPARMASPE
jgi:hypothetical protein